MSCQVRLSEQRESAFTRVECLCCLGAMLLLSCVVLPSLADNRSRSQQVLCIDNLRLIGRAVQVWEAENARVSPWKTVTTPEGTIPRDAQAYMGFRMLSNELVTPKILVCPSDLTRIKKVADNWSTSANGGYGNTAGYGDNATSYTVSYHAFFTEPNSLVSSDRNLRVDAYVRDCVISRTAGSFAEMRVGAQPTGAGWTNNVHGLSGNILTTDGRVTQTSSNSFKAYLGTLQSTSSDRASIHLLIP